MSEIIRYLGLIPLLLLFSINELRLRPDRNFEDSKVPDDAMSGTWNTASPLPSTRYDFGGGVFENKLYVVGGLVLPSPWFPTNIVEAYDPKTDSWEKLPAYPYVVHHEGVVSCGGQLFVVGGYWLRVFPTNRVYSLNTKTKTWDKKADLPTPRGALAVSCIGDSIYAVGGEIQTGEQVATLEIYDTKTNTWSKGPPMPTAREHLTLVSSRGKIHALGGYNESRFNSQTAHEVYDPVTNSWQKRTSLPHAVNGFTASGVGTSIFIFGGARGDAVGAEVFEYKILDDRWVRKANMPTPRYGLVAGTIRDRIYVVGGNGIVKGNYFSNRNDIFTP